MKHQHISALLCAPILLLAAATASAGGLGTVPVPYHLEGGSRYVEVTPGVCPTDPCPCSLYVAEDLTGTFGLRQVASTSPWYDSYELVGIDWMLRELDGSVHIITGMGTYERGGHLVLEHRLTLTLTIDTLTVIHFYDSGWTTAGVGAFPRLEIRAAKYGFTCPDQILVIDAAPDFYYNFCDSTVNSSGYEAVMSAYGSASVLQNDLTLVSHVLPPYTPGIFYMGPIETQIPFGDGYRCITGSGIYRLYPIVLASSTGTLLLELDNTHLPPGVAFIPGDTQKFQAWFRDPFVSGGSGFNLSDGLSITFQP